MSDEFEDDDAGIDNTFDDFGEGGKGTLATAWRDNTLFKVGVVVGVVVLIFLVVSFISREKEAVLGTSYVGGSPNVSTAPGTQEASPAYIQAIEEQNEADREQAELTGGSALPVPIEPPVGVISVPQEEDDVEDPLQRWRRLQEERLQREIQQRETLSAVSVDEGTQREDAVAALADLMRQQMNSILGTRSETKLATLNVTDAEFLRKILEEEEESENADSEEDEFEEEVIQEILFPAGQIAYAQLLTEANTDSPGPVLAEIVAGPLKGARLIGSFEVQEDLLTLNFDTIVIGEESLSIEAVALDPKTTLPGMATEVDHRYLRRLVLPAAAAFVDGLAGAIAESGSTTITINGNSSTTSSTDQDLDSDQEIATGVQEVGQELREILDEMADSTKVLIRIEAGTPIGILFTEPVETEDTAI